MERPLCLTTTRIVHFVVVLRAHLDPKIQNISSVPEYIRHLLPEYIVMPGTKEDYNYDSNGSFWSEFDNLNKDCTYQWAHSHTESAIIVVHEIISRSDNRHAKSPQGSLYNSMDDIGYHDDISMQSSLPNILGMLARINAYFNPRINIALTTDNEMMWM
jgi:hypothetical protein